MVSTSVAVALVLIEDELAPRAAAESLWHARLRTGGARLDGNPPIRADGGRHPTKHVPAERWVPSVLCYHGHVR